MFRSPVTCNRFVLGDSVPARAARWSGISWWLRPLKVPRCPDGSLESTLCEQDPRAMPGRGPHCQPGRLCDGDNRQPDPPVNSASDGFDVYMNGSIGQHEDENVDIALSTVQKDAYQRGAFPASFIFRERLLRKWLIPRVGAYPRMHARRTDLVCGKKPGTVVLGSGQELPIVIGTLRSRALLPDAVRAQCE